AICADDAGRSRDQVDAEGIREATGGFNFRGRRTDTPRQAGHPEVAPVERLARGSNVVIRRPAPVEMAEPEVDRVESGACDLREECVAALVEGADQLVRCGRGRRARAPILPRA